MKHIAVLALLCAVAVPAYAAKSCDELKAEIAKNLDDKGVKGYSLEIVTNADVGTQKIVGSCEGGTKKVIYSKK